MEGKNAERKRQAGYGEKHGQMRIVSQKEKSNGYRRYCLFPPPERHEGHFTQKGFCNGNLSAKEHQLEADRWSSTDLLCS
jgi:hypothetical protein